MNLVPLGTNLDGSESFGTSRSYEVPRPSEKDFEKNDKCYLLRGTLYLLYADLAFAAAVRLVSFYT